MYKNDTSIIVFGQTKYRILLENFMQEHSCLSKDQTLQFGM